MRRVGEALLVQRGHLFPWAPVCLAVGIGVYFALRWEPPVAMLWACGLSGVIALALSGRAGAIWQVPVAAVALAAIGLSLAGWRAHAVGAPVLDWRYYGPVEGRIVGIDRSASDAERLTLDRVVLDRMAPEKTPRRVRLSLHVDDTFAGRVPELGPGMTVIATAHLGPSNGPVEPGGFDFRRHTWFLEIGAVGYTRYPVLPLEPAQPGPGLWVLRTRLALSNHLQNRFPGEVGAFAAAVTTGDRSGIAAPTMQALRDSNLAHLLAISGLHMGLLAGCVFGALRVVLALVPYLALRAPTKSLAAGGALVVAAGYLAMSGGNVSTERAFIMVAVALVAVMLGKRALSLRAVAVAALIVLTLRPEALLGPGFQMSFAATTALVAVFGWMRDNRVRPGPAWAQGAIAVLISSAVAGAATAPIGAAHFNQISHFGLAANLVSVPVMGAVVAPAGVLAAVLAPLGLEGVPLWVMGLGLRWILWVADLVAGWPGAVGAVQGPGPWVLPLMTLGSLVVVLWQGRARWAGLVPMLAAFALWGQAERPAILIAETGGLVGVMTPEGRALSRDRGAGFIARVWLENDGDRASQQEAAQRYQPEVPRTGPLPLRHVHGKRNVAALGPDACAAGEVLVLSHAAPSPLPCDVFDPPRLRRTGAVAVTRAGSGGRIVTVAELAGERLWNAPDLWAERMAARAGRKRPPVRMADGGRAPR